MAIFDELLKEIELPKLVKVKYHFPCGKLDDLQASIIEACKRKNTLGRIKPGNTVAIAVGSREISSFSTIVGTLVSEIKKKGGLPFIVPSMGSHGGATAEGQAEVLANFGITEENIGAPVKSSMETVQIGTTPGNVPVYFDHFALAADCVIPVGRIKPHTDFRGVYESGLMKMIAIGLGKQKGASICHQLGMEAMSKNVFEIATVSLAKTNIIFGLGIIENAFHETFKVVAVPNENIAEEEPALLTEAKSLIPDVPFNKVDVLVVDEMGKDISGTGMDSNVIGRSCCLGISKPFIERIAVLNLTDKSHGNGNGMGLADIASKRFYDKMEFEQTFPNCITSSEPKAVKTPVIMPNDLLTIKCAIKICVENQGKMRLVRIKNTLSMNEFLISEDLIEEAKMNPQIEIVGQPQAMEFDSGGNLKDLYISGAHH